MRRSPGGPGRRKRLDGPVRCSSLVPAQGAGNRMRNEVSAAFRATKSPGTSPVKRRRLGGCFDGLVRNLYQINDQDGDSK